MRIASRKILLGNEANKERLRKEYATLNPVTLVHQMEQRQASLWQQAEVRWTSEATIPAKEASFVRQHVGKLAK